MKTMKKTLILISAGIITSCSSAQVKTPNAGMANPASVYCLQSGGKSEMVQTTEGTHSYCLLPDGERIEEWALYRRDHK